MADTIDIRPGFTDPVIESQRVFRAVLDAMSRPGRIQSVPDGLAPPAPLAVGSAAFCLALADHDTPVWLAPSLRNPATTAFLRFHCGCPIVEEPENAAFAIADAAGLPALHRFALGNDAWPETSTTVVVQVDDLEEGGSLRLTGPGIETAHHLSAPGLLPGLPDEWEANRQMFPCGVDLVLVAGRRIAALPRTTNVTVAAED